MRAVGPKGACVQRTTQPGSCGNHTSVGGDSVKGYRLIRNDSMSWGYLEDASGAKGYAERICIPKDEAELLAELGAARAQQAPVTIAGGGSGLTAGRVPFGGWLISMEKFRRLDVAPGRATVGAGMTLH